MSDTLHPFQLEGRERIERSKARRILCCSPTGSGKTVIASNLTERAVDAGKNVLICCPRQELITQMTAKLDQWLPCGYGLITAGDGSRNIYQQVQVASVDTLVSRAVKRKNMVLPMADLILLDEAHLYATNLRVELLDLFPMAQIVGFTATPCRHDGRALAVLFDELIEIANTRELIEQGYLVPPRYYAPSAPDLTRVKVVAGDYEKKGADAAIQPLLGDIVDHWMRHAADRRTVVFANSIGQSIYLAEQFRAAGVMAEHCDAQTPQEERTAVFGRFRSGETQVLCNVELASYGFDLPELSCAVLARPTLSVVRHLQAIGRALRKAPGKRDALILDHAGSLYGLGFAEDDRYWTLQGLKLREKRERKKVVREYKAPKRMVCPQCKFVFSGSLTCSACGYYFEALAQEFRVVDGELVAILDLKREEYDLFHRISFYCELMGYVQEKNEVRRADGKPAWDLGWCSHMFKSKYGEFPPRDWRNYQSVPPSGETMRFIRYINVRRAKWRESRRQWNGQGAR